MNVERQFWFWVLLLCVGIFTLVGIQVALFYANHGETLRSLPAAFRANLLVFLGIALLSLLPFLIWGMRVWYGRYVVPLHRLHEDVEALVYGSPQARLADDHDDPAGLASLLNALMDRYQHDDAAVEARLQEALGELSTEKTGLESLLDALSEGVLVYGLEGEIRRYNHTLRRLFGDREDLRIGGRVTDLVEADVVHYAGEALQEQLAAGAAHPHVRFVCHGTARSGELHARIAPLMVLGGRLEGYILTIEPPDEDGVGPMAPAGAPGTPLPPPSWEPGVAPRPAPPPDTAKARLPGTAPTAVQAAQPLADLRFVVFDTETTGLNPGQGDGVVQIGAVIVEGGVVQPEAQFSRLANPGRPSSAAAQRVHGIDPAALAGQPPLEALLPDFLRFAEGAVLVAHNAAFDMAFLHAAARRAELTLGQPVLDTMLLSSVLHPNQPTHSLDSLLARYGIPVTDRHSALGDALMTAAVLQRLLPQLAQRGIVTLANALEASRRSPLARLRYDG